MDVTGHLFLATIPKPYSLNPKITEASPARQPLPVVYTAMHGVGDLPAFALNESSIE